MEGGPRLRPCDFRRRSKSHAPDRLFCRQLGPPNFGDRFMAVEDNVIGCGENDT